MEKSFLSKKTMRPARLEPQTSRSGVRGVHHSATVTSTYRIKTHDWQYEQSELHNRATAPLKSLRLCIHFSQASHSVISSPPFDSEFHQPQASTNQFKHHEHVLFPVLKTLHCYNNSPIDDFSPHDLSSGYKPSNQVIVSISAVI